MKNTEETLVDFVAKGNIDSDWLMVLVEEGPISCPVEEFLYSLQHRLYNTIDVVLDGQLAERFPETKSKNIIIRLDCYDLPEYEIDEFFSEFSRGALKSDDYQSALSQNKFVNSIRFECTFDKTK